MVWIRLDSGAPRSDVVGFLAERLDLPNVHAFGHYAACCCGFADERRDGRIDQVPDATLEDWARWTGKRGRFAAALRSWCGQDTSDPGKLRGWWRQAKLLDRQEKDNRRPNSHYRARVTPSKPRNNPVRGNDGVNGDYPSVTPQKPHTQNVKTPLHIVGGTVTVTDSPTENPTPNPFTSRLAELSGTPEPAA